MKRLVELRESPLDGDELERAVAHAAAGAIVSFVGRVRDHNDGKPVTRLEYEAYASMAVKEMERIVDGIEARMPGTRLAVVHRTGMLEVGDAAIVCAASAAHRGEAFDACRLLIDEIKACVPIWKREHGPEGPYWVGWVDARCGGEHASDSEHAPGSGCIHDHGDHQGHHPRRDVEPGGHRARELDESRPPANHRTLDALRVVCITVSDTRTVEDDRSGALAGEHFEAAGAHVERHLVRDDEAAIGELLTRCLNASPHAVFLTGGTGLGPRDVTYEAVTPLCDRALDGFGEAFRRLSFEEIGARALLSRAFAGTAGQTLVFAVPGSPKAVELALRALVIPLLPHAIAMLAGGGH